MSIARQIALAVAVVALAVTSGVLSSPSALAHGAHGQGHHQVSTSYAAVPDVRGVDKMKLDQAADRSNASPEVDAALIGTGQEVRVSVVGTSEGGCNFGGEHVLGTSCCGHACHGGALSVDDGTHQSLPRPQKLALQQPVTLWADIRFGLMRPPPA